MTEYKKPTNEEFAAMSDDQKRVAVAKDVLALLDSRRIVESHGDFLCTPDNALEISIGRAQTESICSVCARGALVFSAFRFGLAHSEHTGASREPLHNMGLNDDDIDLIEHHFEDSEVPIADIMRSIIKNNGEILE